MKGGGSGGRWKWRKRGHASNISSRVSNNDIQQVEHHFKSILISVDVTAKYNDGVLKLK